MIETRRLILRQWRPQDLEPFAAMSADPAVMDWLGGVLTRDEAAAKMASWQAQVEETGLGPLVVERKGDAMFLGLAMLMPVNAEGAMPVGIEVGWRLARDAWGCGYASEAAAAQLTDGFERLGLSEILAFTALSNLRSQAVMKRIGMTRRPLLDFDHPRLAKDSPIRPHVVYGVLSPIRGGTDAR